MNPDPSAPPTGGEPAGGGGGGGGPGNSPIVDGQGMPLNADDKEKATNLVLKRLSEQLEQKKVDPELLRKMGWTEADAKAFVERMRERSKPAAEAPADPLTGKAREEFGQGTNLRRSVRRASGGGVEDTDRQLFEGQRAAPPPEYKEMYEAYTRSLGQQPSPAPPAPPKE